MKHTLLLLLAAFSFATLAQDKQTAAAESSAALESIDGIVNELLDKITIEKGEKMDTAAIRKLFHPSAQFTVLMHLEFGPYAESASLDDFIDMLTDPYYQEGYLEKEIHKVVDEYNGIAQVFQTFYGRDSDGIEERGINSYQLAYYQDRWWIVSMLWTLETDKERIPKKYTGQ
jgi:hypothetical protein